MAYIDIFNEIEKYDTIVIYRHSNPDGDAIGSQVGMKHIIMCNYPDKKVLCVGDSAGRYGFVEDCETDEVSDDVIRGSFAIVLDCGGENMVSDDRYKTALANARIDHHMYTGAFTQTEVIETGFESCCGVITDMVRELGLKLDTIGAKALFTGMVTDSGRFRYDSTNARTFELASFLLKIANIDFNELYANLYAEDFAQIKRKAEFILNIRFTEHEVAYIYTDEEEVKKYNADGMSTFSISRGMVGTMGDIKGVSVWVNFTESDGKVLCELRSNKYNINPIAVKYGGGGHEKASGATVSGKDEAMAMLKDLDALVV